MSETKTDSRTDKIEKMMGIKEVRSVKYNYNIDIYVWACEYDCRLAYIKILKMSEFQLWFAYYDSFFI